MALDTLNKFYSKQALCKHNCKILRYICLPMWTSPAEWVWLQTNPMRTLRRRVSFHCRPTWDCKGKCCEICCCPGRPGCAGCCCSSWGGTWLWLASVWGTRPTWSAAGWVGRTEFIWGRIGAPIPTGNKESVGSWRVLATCVLVSGPSEKGTTQHVLSMVWWHNLAVPPAPSQTPQPWKN